MRTDYTPKEIKGLLDGAVVGQEELKVCLATQFFLHMKKLDQFTKTKDKDVLQSNFKNNILIAGPSGSGKTYSVQKAAEMLGLPFVACSATDLTAPGWSGADLYNVLEDGQKQAKSKFGSHGEVLSKFLVVFIDEMDKLLIPAKGRSGTDHNQQTINSMLVAFNGGTVFSPDSKMGSKGDSIDTSNMLFIVAGVFPAFRKRAEQKDKTVGFVTVENKKKELYDHLLDCKVMPELVGRLTRIVFTEKLSKAELRDILLGPMGVLASYRRLLLPEGLNPVLSEEDIEEIITKVEETEIGVRALSAILGGMLERDIYEGLGE